MGDGDDSSVSSSSVSSSQSAPVGSYNTQESGTQNSQESSTHFSQGNDRTVTNEAKTVDQVDFSSLSGSLKRRAVADRELEITKADFDDRIKVMSTRIEGMAQNMKAGAAYVTAQSRLKESSTGFDEAKQSAKDATRKYSKVKAERTTKFNAAFKVIAVNLDIIYKALTQSSKHPLGGKAYLSLENQDEP